VVTAEQIAAAVEALQSGALVAFPTETVYGLGADATNEQAVRRIFATKGRPADHPVIVHLANPSAIHDWAQSVPPTAIRLAERFWPGPLTLILPRAAHVLDVVTGGQNTVGLRVPDHPVAQALLHAFGKGIAAPSANRFGRISPTQAKHVRDELGQAVALVLDGGPARVGLESSIVDLSGSQPTLLRPGHISAHEIAATLGVPLGLPQPTSPRAPGTLASHYAPVTPVELVGSDELFTRVVATRDQQIAVLALQPAPPMLAGLAWITAPNNPVDYAHDLYANLRALDALDYDRILVEATPDDDAWQAVNDRLRRAAH
jgi:L-threonylcarbamoyladenylate synthase